MNLRNRTPEFAVNHQSVYVVFINEQNDETEEINENFTDILQEAVVK